MLRSPPVASPRSPRNGSRAAVAPRRDRLFGSQHATGVLVFLCMKVRVMRFNDAVLGTAFLLLAGVMIAITFSFPAFPGQNYGPNLFPRIIGGGIVGCALLLILREWRSGAHPFVVLDDWARRPARLASFALMLASMLFYLVASEPLGFIPTAFLIQFGLFLWFGVRPLTALIVAVAMTLTVQYFFGSLMRVPLPRGILDSIL